MSMTEQEKKPNYHHNCPTNNFNGKIYLVPLTSPALFCPNCGRRKYPSHPNERTCGFTLKKIT